VPESEGGEPWTGDWTPSEAGAAEARGDANLAPHLLQMRLPVLTFPQFGQTIPYNMTSQLGKSSQLAKDPLNNDEVADGTTTNHDCAAIPNPNPGHNRNAASAADPPQPENSLAATAGERLEFNQISQDSHAFF